MHFNVLKCISYRETNIFRGSQLCKRGGSNFELGIFEKAQQMGDVLLQKFLYFDSDCLCLDSTSSSFPLLQKLEMADRKQHMPTLRALLLHSIPLPCHPPTRLAPLPPGHMARPRDVGRTLQLDLDLPQPQPWTLQVTVQVAFLI